MDHLFLGPSKAMRCNDMHVGHMTWCMLRFERQKCETGTLYMHCIDNRYMRALFLQSDSWIWNEHTQEAHGTM